MSIVVHQNGTTTFRGLTRYRCKASQIFIVQASLLSSKGTVQRCQASLPINLGCHQDFIDWMILCTSVHRAHLDPEFPFPVEGLLCAHKVRTSLLLPVDWDSVFWCHVWVNWRALLHSRGPESRWRGGRVVEGAALEMLYRGNSIEGSNPSLSV